MNARAAVIASLFAVELSACGAIPTKVGEPDVTADLAPANNGNADLSGGGNTNPDGGGTGSNCGVQNFTLNKAATPDLLIVQDRSGSMAFDSMDNMTTVKANEKWTQIVAALETAVTSVTTIDWGLMMFGTDTQCGAPTAPDVAVAANNGANITAKLNASGPLGGTPTTLALQAAVKYFKALNDGNAHYILLATDGEPNCGANDPFGDLDDSSAAESEVTAAAALGINTFVVGIGSNTGADAALTAMANNGKEPNTTAGQPAYYSVSNTAELTAVLNTIAGQLVSCNYALQTAPQDPADVSITAGSGATIPHDTAHTNGWDFGPNNLSIVFYGQACTDLQMGVTTSISAVYGCPVL